MRIKNEVVFFASLEEKKYILHIKVLNGAVIAVRAISLTQLYLFY